MNCALFAKMDQVFSKENKTLKKYWKIGEKYWKSQGKVREFCQSGKVGTLNYLDSKDQVVLQLIKLTRPFCIYFPTSVNIKIKFVFKIETEHLCFERKCKDI